MIILQTLAIFIAIFSTPMSVALIINLIINYHKQYILPTLVWCVIATIALASALAF